jgi:hypothetical protein
MKLNVFGLYFFKFSRAASYFGSMLMENSIVYFVVYNSLYFIDVMLHFLFAIKNIFNKKSTAYDLNKGQDVLISDYFTQIEQSFQSESERLFHFKTNAKSHLKITPSVTFTSQRNYS